MGSLVLRDMTNDAILFSMTPYIHKNVLQPLNDRIGAKIDSAECIAAFHIALLEGAEHSFVEDTIYHALCIL